MKLKQGKKTGLKYFNISDIRSWDPCYNPNKHLIESFRGTAIDILKNESIPFCDRLWVVLRNEICSDKLMRLAAVYFYRDTLNWISNPDPRSIEAANISEQFALGKATEEQRSAVESAAWSAWSDAWSARSDARSAESSARAAAWSAVESASCRRKGPT